MPNKKNKTAKKTGDRNKRARLNVVVTPSMGQPIIINVNNSTGMKITINTSKKETVVIETNEKPAKKAKKHHEEEPTPKKSKKEIVKEGKKESTVDPFANFKVEEVSHGVYTPKQTIEERSQANMATLPSFHEVSSSSERSKIDSQLEKKNENEFAKRKLQRQKTGQIKMQEHDEATTKYLTRILDVKKSVIYSAPTIRLDDLAGNFTSDELNQIEQIKTDTMLQFRKGEIQPLVIKENELKPTIKVELNTDVKDRKKIVEANREFKLGFSQYKAKDYNKALKSFQKAFPITQKLLNDAEKTVDEAIEKAEQKAKKEKDTVKQQNMIKKAKQKAEKETNLALHKQNAVLVAAYIDYTTQVMLDQKRAQIGPKLYEGVDSVKALRVDDFKFQDPREYSVSTINQPTKAEFEYAQSNFPSPELNNKKRKLTANQFRPLKEVEESKPTKTLRRQVKVNKNNNASTSPKVELAKPVDLFNHVNAKIMQKFFDKDRVKLVVDNTLSLQKFTIPKPPATKSKKSEDTKPPQRKKTKVNAKSVKSSESGFFKATASKESDKSDRKQQNKPFRK